MEYIEEILKVYYQINSIYNNLYKLEYDDKKDSVEFIELLDVLKILILQEKDLFDKLYSQFDDLYEYQVFDNGDPFVKRLNDFMNFYEALNCRINDNDSKEEMDDKIYNMKCGKLYKSCSRNIFLVYLSFLQEYIDDSNYSYMKDKILAFKYYNGFINHDVEGSLVDFNCDINKVNYVNVYLIAESLGIDINMCDNVIIDCFKDTIEVTVSQILSMNDIDYNDVNKYAMVINNQAMLRAGLALLGQYDFDKNRQWLLDIISRLSTNDNQISVSLVNSIIGGITKDSTRVMKISMRPLKG